MPSARDSSCQTKDKDEKTWNHIEKVDTLRIEFDENQRASLPYSMEVCWEDLDNPGGEHFRGTDVNSINYDGDGFNYEDDATSKKFVPALREAAKRTMAKRDSSNLPTLKICYKNGLDRTWPYIKVARIIEIFTAASSSSTKNGKRAATLESVELTDDGFRYTVTFSASDKKKRKKKGQEQDEQCKPFTCNIDFTKYDRMEKVLIKGYIWPGSQMIAEGM